MSLSSDNLCDSTLPIPYGKSSLLKVVRSLGLSCVSTSAETKSVLGRVHTCSGREPDSSVPGARVQFASARGKNRTAAIRSRPVKLKPRVHTATGTRPVLAELHVVNL